MMCYPKFNANAFKAFTLLELLVVIAIIGILTAFLAPSLIGIQGGGM